MFVLPYHLEAISKLLNFTGMEITRSKRLRRHGSERYFRVMAFQVIVVATSYAVAVKISQLSLHVWNISDAKFISAGHL